MEKYRALSMDLADAELVAVAERERIRRIFTTDLRDFSILLEVLDFSVSVMEK